ncbi:integrase core domain-containing protein, partial [Agrobacterium tumefaciens]|uniref:integrase core domain-containing protein n=1 Tax=Agrobacterium tumefaciens TaxID=358 RepID=UPI00384BB472
NTHILEVLRLAMATSNDARLQQKSCAHRSLGDSSSSFRRCYGSCFIASDTKSLLLDIGMEPRTTPIRSPQSNGMAEAFVKTFKRDYVSVNSIPDAKTVIAQLPLWFEHYNTLHPHKALGYRSPREFLNRQTEIWSCPVFMGQLQNLHVECGA